LVGFTCIIGVSAHFGGSSYLQRGVGYGKVGILMLETTILKAGFACITSIIAFIVVVSRINIPTFKSENAP
jgi:hypothetical protein